MVLSVMVHVALAWFVVARWSSLTSLPSQSRSIAEMPRIKPVHAGIEHSLAVSINWLGFATPTHHEATQATTDQAALSPTPSTPTQPTPRPATQPRVLTADSTQNSQKHDQQHTVDAQETSTARAAPALPQNISARRAVIALNERMAKLFKDATSAAQRFQPSLPTPPTPVTHPTRQQPPSNAADSSPTLRRPSRVAERSTKESTPTAVSKPIDWHPGHPAAGQGLDITTVTPRWSETTRLSALPRNPVVRIDFARDGHVVRAAFLPNLDSGYASVDGPLLDAIYRWRARGQALDDLPDGSDAVVSMTVRILLNPSRGKILKPGADTRNK